MAAKSEKVKFISTVKEDLHTASITRGDSSDSRTFRQEVFERESWSERKAQKDQNSLFLWEEKSTFRENQAA